MTHVPTFEKTLQKTMIWVDRVGDAMGSTDQARSYLILRAVLHALRDRLAPEQAVHLGAQLPMLARGFYYEGWHPADTPKKYRHKDEFFEDVHRQVPKLDQAQLERATVAVFDTLEAHMPGGELEKVRHALPRDLRELWPVASA